MRSNPDVIARPQCRRRADGYACLRPARRPNRRDRSTPSKAPRFITAAGPVIANGTIVMRNGVIEDVGANVTVAGRRDGDRRRRAAHAIRASSTWTTPRRSTGAEPAPAAAAGRWTRRRRSCRRARRRSRRSRKPSAPSARRSSAPTTVSADNLRTANAELSQRSRAPASRPCWRCRRTGIFKGQSALVNVAVPPDDPQISTIADYRSGLAVVKSPVAMHVNMSGRGGGQGYPGALLGTIAFTKQGLLDAQWQRDAEAHYAARRRKGPRPLIEPALDALKPALARQMPVAFDANDAREIDRALAMAAAVQTSIRSSSARSTPRSGSPSSQRPRRA